MLSQVSNFMDKVVRRLLAFLQHFRLASNRQPSSFESVKEKRIQIQIEESLEQCKREDFASLRKQFIFFLRPILPEVALRKGWSLLRTMFGPIITTGSPEVSLGWFTDSARLPIQFRRSKIIMVMQFTKSGNVLGLRFLPQSLAGWGVSTSELWRPPAYANLECREEFQITLGSWGTRVSGTLTLPSTEGKYPCLILLAGSGPCDRDSTVKAAKPFKDLAWGFAEKNIATIRFDKVTLTHGKKIAKNPNFTLTDEYVEHAVAALNYAQKHPNIEKESIFLVGHSLGAVVAPKISAIMPSVAGLILMAAPAQPVYRAAIRQLEYISKIESSSIGNEDMEDEGLLELREAADVVDSPDLTTSIPAEKLPFGIGPRYWLDYKTFDPVGTTRNISKPVLILQGEQDFQVTMQDDYAQWYDALKGMPNVDLRTYKTLNHLFMSVEGQSTPSDYEKPCNVDYPVIEEMGQWVRKETGRPEAEMLWYD